MNEISLKKPGINFKAYKPENDYYIDYHKLHNNPLKFKHIIHNKGFIIIKNLISNSSIKKIRNSYFNLFNEEFKKFNGKWYQLKEHKDAHGCGSHPSKKFIRSKEFLSFIEKNNLKKTASILLDSQKVVLSKRAILRSFSNLSKKITYAHRDNEYFISKNPNKVLTAWIPLGSVNKHLGQLIYLENSHNLKFFEGDFNEYDNKIISKEFNSLAKITKRRWLIPTINLGDVIFHNLFSVHASFESNSAIPRLSCDLRFAAADVYLDPRWNKFWEGDDKL